MALRYYRHKASS